MPRSSVLRPGTLRSMRTVKRMPGRQKLERRFKQNFLATMDTQMTKTHSEALRAKTLWLTVRRALLMICRAIESAYPEEFSKK